MFTSYAIALAVADEIPVAQSSNTAMLYILSGIIGTLLGFLMREVIKRLDKQIEISGDSKGRINKVEEDIRSLSASQVKLTDSVIELSNNVRSLTISISQIANEQSEHIKQIKEQVALTKRWHDKLDRAWPIEDERKHG